MKKEDEIHNSGNRVADDDAGNAPDNPSRRETLGKLAKYTPPAMLTLLVKDSAWAQISGGPPPPPSDLRLKTDVHHLGESSQGYPLYRFSYLNDSRRAQYVGVMAQDIIDDHPQAVATSDDGYYAVHYERLGLQMTTYKHWQEQGLKAVEV